MSNIKINGKNIRQIVKNGKNIRRIVKNDKIIWENNNGQQQYSR